MVIAVSFVIKSLICLSPPIPEDTFCRYNQYEQPTITVRQQQLQEFYWRRLFLLCYCLYRCGCYYLFS